MGARHKLNSAYLHSCIAAAALVGLVAQSWTLFLLTLAAAVASCVHSGAIRHRPDAGQPPQRRRARRGR